MDKLHEWEMIVQMEQFSEPTPIWAKILDQSRCIGCHACTTACKSENDVPVSVTRTYVKSVDVGTFPAARRSFQVTRCNQCEDAPCVAACPTQAMYRRSDGIVDFDKSICIGCKACIAACPYDAIFINPDDHSAEKCNFCAHRLDVGLEPACVTVCPVGAIVIGDMNDPQSKVAQMINREPVAVRRPEKETHPKVFYKGAHQATLDPLAAARPEGSTYAWAEKPRGPGQVGAGHPFAANSSAAALLSYDVSHVAPWGWRVSLYTWTKGIAAGAYLAALIAAIATGNWSGPLWLWGAPIVAGIFLAFTGVLLIWDLKHPKRFYMIFTRHHWRSWLVRGAFIIAAYSAVLALHFIAALLGAGQVLPWLAIAGVPLAVATSIYTGYLFAQSKARDLWQNPLLPPHLLVQSLALGAAALLPVAAIVEPDAGVALGILLAIAVVVHLLMIAGESTMGHPTAHARLAAHAMYTGSFAAWFWIGTACVAFAAIAAFAPSIAWPFALAGFALYEHAYVQAGQSVPLA
jgi:Fe-S-cluster-containing dehydrogenase component/formate-dependent nitrite reductase membrane component NrfD